MSKETTFKRRRRKKSPPSEIVPKPPGVDLWTFLVPYLEKLGQIYHKAVDRLTKRAGRRRPEAVDALHDTVVAWITRWTKNARVRIPASWEATLAHEAFHTLFEEPTKDLRLLKFMPFAQDDESPGFPPPIAPILSPPDEAALNELAELPDPTPERLAVCLWRGGFLLGQIATSLRISVNQVRKILAKESQGPQFESPKNDFS